MPTKRLSPGSQVILDEVLNDTWDYLFVGDPFTLLRFQREHGLQEDLLAEFTTTDLGDRAVEEGVVIPLSGIVNQPYTAYFTAHDHEAALLRAESDLQHHQRGYRLHLHGEKLVLYTIPYLRSFSAETAERLAESPIRQVVELSSGWYGVEILAGQTVVQGELEPSLEFVLRPRDEAPEFSGPINYAYRVEAD